jgi:hypothetical protein
MRRVRHGRRMRRRGGLHRGTALLLVVLAGCLAPAAGPDLDAGQAVLLAWRPDACDANASRGLSHDGDLGPFTGTMVDLRRALERLLQAPLLANPGGGGARGWGSANGTVAVGQQDGQVTVAMHLAPWPTREPARALPLFIEALRRFDGSLAWQGSDQNAAAGHIDLHATGTAPQGGLLVVADLSTADEAQAREDGSVAHRLATAVSLRAERTDPPAAVRPADEVDAAARAVVACLQRTGRLSGDWQPFLREDAWSIRYGTWTIAREFVPAGASPDRPGEHCTSGSHTVFLDARTLAVAAQADLVCL